MDLTNENIIHVKNGDNEYLQFKILLKYSDKLTHCYTLKPLDFRNKSKEDENYISISNSLGFDNLKVVMPIQTHTNVVKVAYEDSVSMDFNEVDGLITNVKNKVLASVSADCISILLYDPVKNVVGNVHSGWKGTVNKIGKVAIEEMQRAYDCKCEDIICCICPSIGQCHFEVEDDVKELFMKAFNDESIIKKGKIIDGKQKYYIDSVLTNKKMFESLGLLPDNIVSADICTVCENELFHSFRCGKDMAGRNAAIIGLV